MNKLLNLVLGGAVTLAIGAGAILGNGVLASKVMDSNINPEDFSNLSSHVSEVKNDIEGISEIENIEEATYEVSEGVQTSSETKGSSVVLASDVENGGTIIINGKEMLLSDYLNGEEPGEDDISSATAIDSAVKELTQKYALKQEVLDRYTITTKFYSMYEDISSEPVWWVNLYPTNTDDFAEIGCYSAILDSKTGEVLALVSAADGKG